MDPQHQQYTEEEKREFIWGDINFEFSMPTNNDLALHYIATQYLASAFKRDGFDGVIYRSSVHPEGYNIALFRPAVAQLKKRSIFEITKVNYDEQQIGEWFE